MRDANDNMLTITDARGNVALSNSFDAKGRVVYQTLPQGGPVTFAYTEDANGNVVSTQITDGRGIKKALHRDKRKFSP